MRDKIFAAAESIAATGARVKVKDVRDIIKTGSFSTIGPILKEWRASRPSPLMVAEVEIPDIITKTLTEAGKRAWSEAQAVASTGLNTIRHEMELAKDDFAAEISDIEDALKTVEGERDTLSENLDTVKRDLSGARSEIADLSNRLAVANAANADQTEARKNAEVLAESERVRADRAEATLDAERTRIEKLDTAISDLRNLDIEQKTRIASLSAKLDAANSFEKRADAAEAELANLRKSHADQITRMEKQIEDLHAKNEKTLADLGTARTDLATERSAHNGTRTTLSERLERLSVDHENTMEKLKKLRAEQPMPQRQIGAPRK